MKKIIALLLTTLLLASFSACGKTKPNDQNDAASLSASEHGADETVSGSSGSQTVDVNALNWVKSELDCYGYGTGGVDCYLSFAHPDSFTAAESDEDGEQYRGYYFQPGNPDATANESAYGVYAYFLQGGYGARRADFEEDVQGGLQERELGGRTVLFGELPADENTGSHVFVYYAAYSDDDWARIWVILTDPEADGAFRRTFEQSLSFVKE